MKITRHKIPEATLEEFAEANGLEMHVYERSRDDVAAGRAPYYAKFEASEIVERGALVSVFGNGATEEAAMADYAREISEKLMVVAAYTPRRREIQVPRLTRRQ